MKKLVSLVLALVLVLAMLPANTFAVQIPQTQTKTFTLDEDQIARYNPDLADMEVSVTVTVDGYLGEIDSKAIGFTDPVNYWAWYQTHATAAENPVMVLKSGSEVKFTINSNDPRAYCNPVYEATEADRDPDGWFPIMDDSGGGISIFPSPNGNGRLTSYQNFVMSNYDGTAYMNAGMTVVANARKISTNSYAYTADEGLFIFDFNSYDPAIFADGYSSVGPCGDIVYTLGAFLFVSDEQIAEMEQNNGAATFRKDLAEREFPSEFYYTHAYPGLAELFGIEVESRPPISFNFDDNYYISDLGPINDITFTNNSNERISGAFSLLIYNPEAFCVACRYGVADEHDDAIIAHLYPVDIDLDPGESMTQTAYFGAEYNMTRLKYVWVEYDDAAERAQYLNKAGATPDISVEYGESYDYLAYWHLDADYLAQYPYNITFAPVNHK